MANQTKNSNTQTSAKNLSSFRSNRIQSLKEMYADEQSMRRNVGSTTSYRARQFHDSFEVRRSLYDAVSNQKEIIQASNRLFSTNPIYAAVVNYLRNMFTWQYTVIPHRLYTSSRIKAKKELNEDKYRVTLSLMEEVVDGLGIETKFPSILGRMFVDGSVYFTTICDEDSVAIDTVVLPAKYCRKVGESQFGSAVIDFDFSFFDDQSLNAEDKAAFIKTFSKEFQRKYTQYKQGKAKNWQTLDARFSSCLTLNDVAVPTYFYMLSGLLDFEKYQDNELQRNENLLKYLVVHTMPHYEDKLIFEVDEVNAIHKSMKRVIETNDYARLVTTYGDVHVEQIGDSDSAADDTLENAYETVFKDAGLNSGLFTGSTDHALDLSVQRDKSMVWSFVQQLVNFYNIAINNWFDFGNFQADFEILEISTYSYNEDITNFKTNATLGVGKLRYVVASGIKQKNIQDTLYLETFLGLNNLTPMQTSYTQTAEDRNAESTTSEQKEDTSADKTETADSVESTDSTSDTSVQDDQAANQKDAGIEPSAE